MYMNVCVYTHTHIYSHIFHSRNPSPSFLKLKDTFQNAGARVARFYLAVEMTLQVIKMYVFFYPLKFSPERDTFRLIYSLKFSPGSFTIDFQTR